MWKLPSSASAMVIEPSVSNPSRWPRTRSRMSSTSLARPKSPFGVSALPGCSISPAPCLVFFSCSSFSFAVCLPCGLLRSLGAGPLALLLLRLAERAAVRLPRLELEVEPAAGIGVADLELVVRRSPRRRGWAAPRPPRPSAVAWATVAGVAEEAAGARGARRLLLRWNRAPARSATRCRARTSHAISTRSCRSGWPPESRRRRCGRSPARHSAPTAVTLRSAIPQTRRIWPGLSPRTLGSAALNVNVAPSGSPAGASGWSRPGRAAPYCRSRSRRRWRRGRCPPFRDSVGCRPSRPPAAERRRAGVGRRRRR